MDRELSSPTCFLDIHEKYLDRQFSADHRPTKSRYNMASTIPTAARVVESAVISAPLSKVWHLIKLQDFATFWTNLSKSEITKGVSPDTDVIKWTFQDGTVLEVKQEEHSTIEHFITYSVITAKPALDYTSVLSTVRLFPITSGEHRGHTFVQWSGQFSSDASVGVIEDAKYKRREALADLEKAVGKSA
ncbi:Bet v1-like protein [Eremomyces bilateralis CBS 781.70]|uniref:Bet v1-like protein n=1 Tax=Eremomyces bilateralis CBS 781.70 TaxID=1392243 RepID=A0A6G1G115_9PEZI|nr:Bet v1-like protein [Eremomyces bilateralis CBS 781.70]KAF1811499.1 Bet v1-like protein [Eremomyces bilateralis CBS 781.70]